ncbi:MAG: hypothetical protein MUD06_05275 [Rhodospirillales bacterium]|jgi:hypothetical protein|nr:hypothetical protein [Rhodospirillales bacterium]
MALALPGAAWAAEPGEFVTCTLTAGAGGTLEKLQADVAAAADIDPASVRIDYVVVYSNALQNHGQPLPGGETTGPVLCADANSVSVSETSSDAPIPATASAAGIDIIETDQSLQVQYAEDENTKTLLCASYGDLDRCKGIAPVAVEPE